MVPEILRDCENLSFDRMGFELSSAAAPMRSMRKPDRTDPNAPLAWQQRREPQGDNDQPGRQRAYGAQARHRAVAKVELPALQKPGRANRECGRRSNEENLAQLAISRFPQFDKSLVRFGVQMVERVSAKANRPPWFRGLWHAEGMFLHARPDALQSGSNVMRDVDGEALHHVISNSIRDHASRSAASTSAGVSARAKMKPG